MRILIVEDDVQLAQTMSFALRREGYETDICHDGDDGLRWAREQGHDLILLDRMLPALDGISVLQRLRAEKIATPVVLVTALGDVGQRVEGLDAGADDYLVKPFAVEELLARVRALARRPRHWQSAETIEYCDILFDGAKKSLRGGAGECALSRREAALLETLLKNPGQTMPRMVLLTRVWGPDAGVEEGNLDNYIHFLRRRLRTVGSSITIQTVRGVGYRVEEEHA